MSILKDCLKCFLVSVAINLLINNSLKLDDYEFVSVVTLQVALFFLVSIVYNSSRKVIEIFQKPSLFQAFYVLIAILYLISLFSSSYIEEEHQIWYYFESTQFFLIICIALKTLRKMNDLISISSLMLFSRILRTINSTGNKWAHLKDYGDVLREYDLK